MIDKILSKMTLEDKIVLCSGKNFWETKTFEKYGIPSIFVCDGPLGLRKQEKASDMLGINNSRAATCFPGEVTTAGSWDTNLLERIGRTIGEEAREQNADVVLGPGVNLKRNPLCGRNFEYFSEDPYLTGKLAAGFIRGAQAQGIGTSLKHFAVNSQENDRFTSNSILDERTLRELYLTAFEIAIKEGKPSTVMCSYPKVNGIHSSDNKELLTDILREEWGFDGMVITDWGAMNDRIEGFRAGCDLNMPGGSCYMEKDVLREVKAGNLPEAMVDASARRVLELVLRSAENRRRPFACDYDAHHALAVEAAVSGAVLLKNEDDILPLNENAKIAVIGYMAKEMRYQGAGSSHINPTQLSQPLDFLPGVVFETGCDNQGNTNELLLTEASTAAKLAEIAVVFAGLPERYESEGFDRENMQMPSGYLSLIETVSEANPNTVVVLFSGSVVECPFADKVKAILYMGLPGQGGGEAIARLLFGKDNPSGKLAESWPYHYTDVPTSEIYDKTTDALYEEGIYVGYRYYDKAKLPVRWPFGYGLSYTKFCYYKLYAEGRKIYVTVKNCGSRPGAEVVQLYIVAPQQGLHRPIRELKGFQKVFLYPDEFKTISFTLDERSFAVWNNGWVVPGGCYEIQVGELKIPMEIEGVHISAPDWQKDSFYEKCQGKPCQKEWEKMLGRKYYAPVLKKGCFTMENTVEEMKEYSFIMKMMYISTEAVIARGFDGKKDYNNPDFKMLMKSSAGGPLRSMKISGGIKGGLLEGMLEMANGHFLRGVRKMLEK